MKDKEKQEKVFDILNKFEFFQGQTAGRELWNDKPKEVQDKDISDFIKDINYIRSYLQDSVVLSREEYEKLRSLYDCEQGSYMTSNIGDLPLTVEGLRKAVDEITRLNRVETELQELNIKYYNEAKDSRRELKQTRKETAEKLLNDFKLWAREYQYKDTVVDENGERPMTNNEKLNYLYTYLCDKYKVEIKE